jgi:hypothetical protein
VDEQLAELFLTFLNDPSLVNFRAVRECAVTDPAYDPTPGLADELVDLYEQGRFQEVVSGLEGSLPNLLLSPRAQRAAGLALERLGRQADADTQNRIVQCLLDAMLASGDGSEQAPYLVTHVSDEYDLLAYLEQACSETKETIHRDGRTCDVLERTDGTKVWFDNSCIAEALARQDRP